MLICSACRKIFEATFNVMCPYCGAHSRSGYDFSSGDEYLSENIPLVLEERKKVGLDRLVGGLECVILNTEPRYLKAVVGELLAITGFEYREGYEDDSTMTCVLGTAGSADILVRSRKGSIYNPFTPFNIYPKSANMPNTRVETYVFGTPDIEEYVAIQKSRGVSFLSDLITYTDSYSFIQTVPSPYTGNSIGFIEWKDERGRYCSPPAQPFTMKIAKPDRPYLVNIGHLDHAATRVKAEERNTAIIEFMILTDYVFSFAIFVKSLNSITSVTRLDGEEFAMVFTSGKSMYSGDEVSGPTEKFIHNYGPRTHHLAFQTENIEAVYKGLRGDGVEFLIDLVGSLDEGLKQTFTVASEITLLVTEYIYRYGDFDGFFTKSNVIELTRATGKQ